MITREPRERGASHATAEDFFEHIFAPAEGWLVAFTGRQMRLDDPDARANDLGNSTHTRAFRYPEQAAEAAEFLTAEAEDGRDAYQGIHLYKTAAGRKGGNAVENVSCLWLDEDEGEYPPDGPAPTAVVRSSEGRRHLYWRLTRPIPIDDAVTLSKRIAVWAGGDTGKAARATVLRAPGTANYERYPKVDLVTAELSSTEAWDPEEIDRAVAELEPASHTPIDPDEPPVRLNEKSMRVWRGEDPALKEDGTVDRSRTLWKIASMLLKARATRSAVAAAIAERDETLGYRKYTNYPQQYTKIAERIEDSPAPSYMRTDTGNGERFAAQHGKDVRWIKKWGKHLVWSGRVWQIDDFEDVSRRAQRTAKSIFGEAQREGVDTEEQGKIAAHAIASQSARSLRAMVDLAKPHIASAHTEFDPDPWLLNCQNGTIDLRTGELREHRRSDMITKVTPVEYNPAATAPTFHAFLEQILPGEALRGFVQRAFGMALSGEIRDNVLVIFHGTGSNGKSTLVEALMEAFGDYAKAAAPELLMVKVNSHPTELADLFGARLVSCMESEEGRRLNEGLVKQLTGRDTISARRMREDFWEFNPTHSVVFGTNHKPEIRGTDYAIWRRLKLVPFDVTIPDAEQDKDLPTKLEAELPGILRWAVEGCLEWQRNGLQEPDEVTTATQAYRSEMDVLAAFIEDVCVEDEEAETPATALHTVYQHWCRDHNETALKQRTFGMRLAERGYRSFKYTSGVNKDRSGWAGLGIRSDYAPDDDPGGGERRIERRKDFAQKPIDKPKNPPSEDQSGGSGQRSSITAKTPSSRENYAESSSASSASSAAARLSEKQAACTHPKRSRVVGPDGGMDACGLCGVYGLSE